MSEESVHFYIDSLNHSFTVVSCGIILRDVMPTVACRRHLRSFFTCIRVFSHMEDEKGNKLHLFKKYFKMMFLLYKPSLVLIVIHFNRFLCVESFCKEKLKSKIGGF